jgi:signal transduction histidine kinase
VEVQDRPAFTPQERDLMRAAVRLVAHLVEREQLARERAEARTRALALEEANRRMDEFLGIASHELRTPLTSVTANVQLAERRLRSLSSMDAQGERTPDEPGDDAQRAHMLLERSARQLTRLDRLVGDLLDSSRVQAGKLEMRPQPCDLMEIVRDAVREQRTAWPGRDITLDLPRRAAVSLYSDVDRIGQVITNYLSNALKYSAEDAPVEMRLRVRGDTARVEVRDRGPGLTREQQEQLFERFYRAPGIEQQSGSGVGLGLGLYICRTIVERHGGAVGVESVPGDGATFWFTLPLA